MNRKEELLHNLNTLEFKGKLRCLETLFQTIEQLVFYFEARAQAKQAELLMACNWQLKERMHYDKEEQWLWTFVWMKDKVLRKLGVEAKAMVEVRVDPSANLKARADVETQVFEVQEVLESRYVLSSPHHWLIGQSWERNRPLGIGSL